MSRKFLCCFLGFAAAPFAAGFVYFCEMSSAYLVMWKNFFGAHYKIPLETPKPLIILLTGIFPQWCNFFIAPLLMTLLIFAMIRFLRLLGAGKTAVLAAVLLFIFCNPQVIPFYFTYGFSYWPIVYLPILMWCAVFFFEGRYAAASVLLFFASLTRPEAWIFAVAILAYLLVKREKLKVVYFLPLCAPFIWMAVDYRIGGTFFLSGIITRHYAFVTQSFTKPTSFKTYWLWVFKILIIDFNAIAFFLGIVGIFLRGKNKGAYWAKEKLFLTAIFSGICCHWLVCLGGDFTIQARFLAFPALFIALYAGLLGDKAFTGGRVAKPYVFLCFILLAISAIGIAHWDRGTFYNGMFHKDNEKAVGEVRRFLSQNPDLIKARQAIVVPAREGGDFALMLGEAPSHKLVFFREALADKRVKVDNAIGIYLRDETLGLSELKNCVKTVVSLNGRNYCFDPIFIASDKRVVVYDIKRSQL
jgi:hypothetical protein